MVDDVDEAIQNWVDFVDHGIWRATFKPGIHEYRCEPSAMNQVHYVTLPGPTQLMIRVTPPMIIPPIRTARARRVLSP